MSHMPIQQSGPPKRETPDFSSASDVFAGLTAVAHEAESARGYVGEAFRAIAKSYAAIYAVVYFEIDGRVVSDHWHTGNHDPSLWKEKTEQFLTQAQVLSKPRARVFETRDAAARIAILSCPIPDAQGRTKGAIALVVPCDSRDHAHEILADVRACAGVLSTVSAILSMRAVQTQTATPSSDISGVVGALASVSQRKSPHELAFAITNTLRSKVGAEQVALGRVRHNRVRVLSVSGFDKLSKRSPGVSAVADAMEECLDTGSTIVCQLQADVKDTLDTDYRIHRAWQSEAHGATVASIPLTHETGIAAILSIRLMPGKRFTQDELKAIETAVAPYGLALSLVDRATRSLVGHAAATVHSGAREFVNPASVARRLASIACCLGALWFAIASIPFHVTVPAVVMPKSIQHIVVPFDAPVAEVLVRAGDSVKVGDVLCTLGTRSLSLQRAEAVATLKSVRIQADIARAEGLMSRAEQLRAEADVQEARLAMLDDQIMSASMVSPVDGIVMTSSVSEHVGQMLSIGSPMFQIAPISSLRIELEVEESSAARVHDATGGRFSSAAKPEEHRAIHIDQRLPLAEVRDGKSVFVSYADIVDEDRVDWLRPGMKGVVRIDAGKRKAWWVVLRRAIDFANMRLWL